MVLVQPGGNQPVKKIVREPEWGTSSPGVIVLESKDRKQRDIALEESKAKEKSLTDTRMTLRSLSETLQTTALPSSPLYLIPSTSYQHATRGYNGYLVAYFRIFFCTRHTLRMHIPSRHMISISRVSSII